MAPADGSIMDASDESPGDGPFSVESGGVSVAGERAGEGIPIVLLHGLTATRRYVVMGSRALERSGHLVVAYDARGHGASSPAPEPGAYSYALLADDPAAGARWRLDRARRARRRVDGRAHGADARAAQPRARRRPGADHSVIRSGR